MIRFRLLCISFAVLCCARLSATGQANPEAKAPYEGGKRLAQSRMFKGAVEEFTKAIAADAAFGEAYVDRGNAYTELQMRDLAIADYTRAIAIEEKKPPTPDRDRALWRAYTNRGTLRRRSEEWAEAIADYNRAVVLKPDAQIAYVGRAHAYLGSGDQARGDADLRKVAELAGETVATYVDLGLKALEAGDMSDARSYAYRALVLDPKSDRAYALSGEAWVGKRSDIAAADYLKALALNPANAVALSGLGAIEQGRGDAAKSRKYLDDALKADPTSGLTYFRMGSYARKFKPGTEGTREALDLFSKAVELAPKLAVAWHARSVLYLDMKENEKAAADLTRAIELNPNYPDALSSRGVAYRRLGKNDLALADYTRCIELAPAFRPAFYNRAKLYETLGQLPSALRDICRACRLDPTNQQCLSFQARIFNLLNIDPTALFQEGIQALNAENPDRAIEQFRKVIDYAAYLPKAHYNRALAYQMKRDYSSMRADLEESVKLQPNEITPHLLLGWTLGTALGQPAEAAIHFHKAIALDPKNAAAHSGLADTLYDRKDYKAALASYILAAQLDPSLASAFTGKAKTYFRLQEWERSFAAYSRAVALDPKDAGSIRMLAYLHYKMGDYDTAVSELARALKMNPKLANIQMSKVVAEENKKEWALRLHPAGDD